jgi:hypothetical protein
VPAKNDPPLLPDPNTIDMLWTAFIDCRQVFSILSTCSSLIPYRPCMRFMMSPENLVIASAAAGESIAPPATANVPAGSLASGSSPAGGHAKSRAHSPPATSLVRLTARSVLGLPNWSPTP